MYLSITQEPDHLKHGRLILKQDGDVFVVSVSPKLWVGEFRERSDICPGLTPGPAEEVKQFGLDIGTLGLKKRCCESRRKQQQKEQGAGQSVENPDKVSLNISTGQS